MRHKRRLLTMLILGMLLIGPSCSDIQNPLFDYQTIWKCHHENTWDYELTRNKIVGLWEWKYTKCCGETTSPYQNGTESKGLKVEFNADGTGILTDKDVIEEFNWDIEALVNENGLYEFKITSKISQLYGRLLFCDNIMMCNSSYKDGADNFFKKTEIGID
uniref:hypothetical protein n=3 Tax=Roseivirga sp. TaxID=1964215 RepID=UPI004047A225